MAITFALLSLLFLVLVLVAAIVVGLALAVPVFMLGLFVLSFSSRWCLIRLAPDTLQSWSVLDRVLLGITWVSGFGFVVVVTGIAAIFWAVTR